MTQSNEVEQPITVLRDTTEPITFDERQQQFIDTVLIPKTMGRAAKDVRAELATTKERLATAEAALKATNPNSTETEKLKAERDLAIAEAASIRAAAAEATRTADIERELSKAGVIDPALLRTAIADRIQRQGNGYEILDEAGTVREGVTLEKFVQEEASKRPYLVRGQVITGTGSVGSWASSKPISADPPLEVLFGPKSDSRLINSIAIRDNAKFQRLRLEARRKGLIG